MGLERAELTSGDINEQVRGLISERYVAPDYLGLFQEVFEAQYKIETILQAKSLYPLVIKEEADRRLGQGLPVIDPNRLQFDDKDLRDLLQPICTALAKRAGHDNSVAGWLPEAVDSGRLSLREMARRVLAYDGKYFKQLSEETSQDEEALIFVAKALVTPFLRACSRSLTRQLDLDPAFTRRCPICGGAPLMGKLRREDGKRMLECSLCSTQWLFERLRCPFCGNEDQDTLGFFFVEEKSAYRVDKCDICKKYIKTIDERKRAEDKARVLIVEDAATIYLDIMAAKEGYHSISESFWKEVTVNG